MDFLSAQDIAAIPIEKRSVACVCGWGCVKPTIAAAIDAAHEHERDAIEGCDHVISIACVQKGGRK